jgi:hypothetical protein
LSPFTLCKTDDIWFSTRLNFFFVCTIWNLSCHTFTWFKSCHTLAYLAVHWQCDIWFSTRLNFFFVCTIWNLSCHTFIWCKSCHTLVLAILFYIIWIT